MRTPDIRPITVLTRAILDSAPAWMIIAGNAFPDMKPVHRVEHLLSEQIQCRHDSMGTSLWVASNSGWHIAPATCYPCKPLPPFEFLPWPTLPGEVEIDDWRGLSEGTPTMTTLYRNGKDRDVWSLQDDSGGRYISLHHIDTIDGMHPSPRHRINPDGSVTPVWVWEKDR